MISKKDLELYNRLPVYLVLKTLEDEGVDKFIIKHWANKWKFILRKTKWPVNLGETRE